MGISQGDLEYISRCLLDEIRIRGCLYRELLRYHPQHSSCPSYTKAAEWERRMKQPQGYAFSCEQPVPYLDSATIPYGIKLHNPWRKPKTGGRAPSLERILKHLLTRCGSIEPTEEQMVELLVYAFKMVL